MRSLVVILCLHAISALPVSARIWNVPNDAPTIQAGIDSAVTDDVVELATGIFTGNGNRDIDFLGKAIIVRSKSGNPEDCIIDCQGSEMEPHRGFTFHNGETASSVLAGITIQNGWGPEDGPYGVSVGGGIKLDGSFPTLNHCSFSFNTAVNGGAMHLTASSPALDTCVFTSNESSHGGGMYLTQSSPAMSDCSFQGNGGNGGGISMHDNSSPSTTRCIFSENSADYEGGGMVCNDSSPTLTECSFIGNTSDFAGAGALIWGNSSALFIACTFVDNSATRGGGMRCWYNSFVTLLNCTFVNNSAPIGGGIETLGNTTLTLENSIIAFCLQGEAINCGATNPAPALTCCNIFGNAGGDWVGCISEQVELNGNLSANPCFCNGGDNNFYLCADSWCLPGNHPWGCGDLIGALGQGCEACDCPPPLSTESLTWGGVKVQYR